MKLLMLCREPRLYSCQRLQQAAQQRGYRLEILDPNRFLLKLEQGGFHAYYQDHAVGYVQKLADYLGVIPRFGTTSTEMGCNVLAHFERQGVAVLNHSAAFRLARDKWQSLQALVAQGIAVPDSLIYGEEYDTSESLHHLPLPLVIKTLSGSQGTGVMLAEQASSAKSLLDTLRTAKIGTLQQRFVQEANGQDIRAFVIGDRVVAAMVRQSADGEFRANIHQGGSALAITLSAAEQQMAMAAAHAIGLAVAGVDLIRAELGLQVLEVNASPGLEMIERVSQVDIAGLMIEHLIASIR